MLRRDNWIRVIAIYALVVLAGARGDTVPAGRVELTYSLDGRGLLSSVSDGRTAFDLTGDDLVVETDWATYRLAAMPVKRLDGRCFRYSSPEAEITLSYDLVRGAPFVRRTMDMVFRRPTVLRRITRPLPPGGTAFLYHVFWNASAAAFVRAGDRGLACGFENPYCALDGRALSFEPALMLAAGETFSCDVDFTGVYRLSGEIVRPELNASPIRRGGRCHPRYRNPDEGLALDRAEIAVLNAYMRDYCAVDEKSFRLTSYQFFSNLSQRPATAEAREAYLRNLRGIAALGGDSAILNPLCHNSIPNADPNSFWGFFPEGSIAAEIRAYAAKLGLRTGIYMGTAGTGACGNSSMISYADVTAWKKIDRAGASSGENCLACDAFVDWYVRVQTNTIARYDLDIWNWDPGPGNGFYCHAKDHGHLPGKGAYKGYRNALKVMKALRDFKPSLYYQGFHGLKEYGTWGFKYMDQQEAYWENDVYDKMPVFADLSADRQTADGIRFQSRWDHDFRFLPPALNHGLAHRMVQACYMGLADFDLAFDGCGWQYALLSAIAAGGPVTLPILPRDVDAVPGYRAFYARWIAWAREHFDWMTVPVGATPYCGAPDGFAKFKDGEAFVFMFNPYPYPLAAQVTPDAALGLGGEEQVVVSRVYPAPAALGYATRGKDFNFVVPDYGCVVLRFGPGTSVDAAPQTPPLPRTLTLVGTGGERTARFVGLPAMRKALTTYAALVTDRSRAAVDDYLARRGRINGVWTRPDRLWLWIVPDELGGGEDFAVTLNGRPLTLTRDRIDVQGNRIDTLWFADVTDVVDFGGENALVMKGNAADLDGLTAYLHYPRPETESVPSAVRRAPQGPFAAPVQDAHVKVLSAELNGGCDLMRPESENVLTVRVNTPDAETVGVYASVPISIGATGNELRTDMALDRKGDGVWEKRFSSGGRLSLIVDDRQITCWAVTTNRTESASFVLPFEWLLARPQN